MSKQTHPTLNLGHQRFKLDIRYSLLYVYFITMFVDFDIESLYI
ncbi:hypothetical protein BOH78_0556 [Pichia kudriavzevii]|uniref:Uncharacterized protein n=1 Tax=Pichia kudriavzevii TaxID=4909 RepID=A0A099NSM4_PICKU|nr:hypothetical protein JL09_g5250 [Pichia kudriavzevii]ONH71028.1 hypothetical protein BOH78_4798 [Pichia kudriavzevii]ONH77262.1 hypothetical protein BOH78_0556 [Pichia kudriavzevii]